MTGVIIVGLSAPARASHQDNLPDPDNTTQCVKSPSIVPKTVIARDQGFAQLDRTDIDTQYCTGDDIWVQDYTYGATAASHLSRTTPTTSPPSTVASSPGGTGRHGTPGGWPGDEFRLQRRSIPHQPPRP